MTDNNPPNGFQMGNISILPNAVCIFGVISHVLLLIAFIKDPLKCFKNSGTYLVANLAVSDLLTCLIGPFSYCIPTETYWFLQPVFVTITASILTIASISLDRFLMVVYPMKHRVFMNGKVIIVWSACIWLICFISSMKTFLLSTSNDTEQIINLLAGVPAITFAGVMYGFTYYKLKKTIQKFTSRKCFQSPATGASYERKTIFEDNYFNSLYRCGLCHSFDDILHICCSPKNIYRWLSCSDSDRDFYWNILREFCCESNGVCTAFTKL